MTLLSAALGWRGVAGLWREHGRVPLRTTALAGAALQRAPITAGGAPAVAQTGRTQAPGQARPDQAGAVQHLEVKLHVQGQGRLGEDVALEVGQEAVQLFPGRALWAAVAAEELLAR